MAMETEQATRLAAKLYECRDAAKRLLGAHYKRDMDLWAIAIRGDAEQKKCSDLEAATDIANKAGGFGAIVVLAAYVEMAEPPNVEVTGLAAASLPQGPRGLPGSTTTEET